MAVWACKLLGINRDHMYEKKAENFAKESEEKEFDEQLCQMRLEFYEKRRMNKMRVVVDFIKQNHQKYVPPAPKRGK